MIYLYYPPGAGGVWLMTTCTLAPLTQDRYVHFHSVDIKNNWIKTGHTVDMYGPGVLFSGSYYFNFFLNHIYKFFYYGLNLFESDYKNYFLNIVAVAFEICKFSIYTNKVDFDFDDLVNNPYVFYNSITTLQKNNNKSIIEYDDFYLRRKKFIASCINPVDMVENFDNMIWVAFVLGQLMIHNICPEFLISELSNQDKCKQFAKENYYKCQLNNFYNFETTTLLPKFKFLS